MTSKQRKPLTIYHPGEIYSFRTAPATELAPKTTGRYAALKIVGTSDTTVFYILLSWAFDRPPGFADASNLEPLLIIQRPGDSLSPLRGSELDWENDLEDFTLVGRVQLSQAEMALASACRSFGPWIHAAKIAEMQWRKKNDLANYTAEVARSREIAHARLLKERERYEKRLKTLTWDKLLHEPLLERWNEHPPFPSPEFTSAAREQIRALMQQLRALGHKPTKAKTRSLVKATVEFLNRLDEQFGDAIETEEREDILNVLEEIAFVAGHPSVSEEIEGWRKW